MPDPEHDTVFELPLFGMVSDNYRDLSTSGKAWDIARHMILPVTCYTYGSLAYFSRFVKSNMEEVVRQDYIRTARAKGVGPFRVIVHHAFRNTLIPFVTLIGLSLPTLVSGSVILEQIFVVPGMGLLLLEAVFQRDYPVISGVFLVVGVGVLLINLLVDLSYGLLDPKVRHE